MSIEIKYIPLSFINTDEEILKQIKNTVLFSYLFQKFDETSLSHYLESTQYGYTASALKSGKHQLVRITDINSGKVDWNTVPFCDCDAEGKYLLKDDDILVARTGGTTGKSFIVNSAPDNAVFASYLIRLRLKKDVNLEFINLYLNSYAFWSQIVEMKSGSAMPNVNAEKLKTLRIPKASFKEQNEFVTAFKNVEKAKNLNFVFDKINEVESLFINSKEIINELTHQLDLVRQLRQSFLREAMQGKLVKSTNTTETGQQLLIKIKAEKAKLIAEKKLKKEKELPPIVEEEIPFEIPKHWAWCRLGEISNFISGTNFNSSDFKKGEGVKCIKITNAGVGELIETDDVLPYNFIEKYSNYIVYQGDLILALTRPYIAEGLKISKCNNVYNNSLLNQRVALIRNYPAISNEYIYKYLRSDYVLNKYKSMFEGKGQQPNLKKEDVTELLFPLPPLHEQEQIVAKLEELMGFCDGLEQSIKESQGYNEMLLQQVLREALQGEEV